MGKQGESVLEQICNQLTEKGKIISSFDE